MAVYAYLRVSTDWRDVQNQRHGILEYANVRNLESLEFVEDEASGRMNWRERAIDLPPFFLTPSLRATEVLGCTKFPTLCASH
jgi:hypothetical protein